MIVNLTPHPLNVIDRKSVTFEPALRKYIAAEPVVIETIPSSGMVSVKFEERESVVEGFPFFEKVVASRDELPVGDDTCVVSALYYGALAIGGSDWQRCVTVANPVYAPDGRMIVGCLGFGRVKF